MPDTKDQTCPATESLPDLILGTAGHIDHGKSTLVEALTNTNPDRLAEEKERGITITLGFAQITLPSGRTMGVVDVPGHEKFVKQMIAGATGIDVALLVIAADDGIMPQTTEHIAVLQMLGITSCVVALTKIDKVDDEWAEFVKEEIASYLQNTAFANAPIVEVSAVTGQGIDKLRQAIDEVATRNPKDSKNDIIRLPIDRAFTIKGSGTVVTGTLWSGLVSVDDVLEILPAGNKTRVRSIEIHDKSQQIAQPGNRVALNLSDVKKDDLSLGDFLCTPNSIKPTDHFDARLTYLDVANKGKPLISGARVHVAHGTQEVIGRVLLINGQEELVANDTAFVQIRLEEPLPVSYHDHFVIRSYSPVTVAGGGEVILAHPRRRTNVDDTELRIIESLSENDPKRAIDSIFEHAHSPLTAGEIATYIGMPVKEVQELLLAALDTSHIILIGKYEASHPNALFTTQSLLTKIQGDIESKLAAFYEENPLERGINKDNLLHLVTHHMDPDTFDAILAFLVNKEILVVSGRIIGSAEKQASIAQAENTAAQQVYKALQDEDLPLQTLSQIKENTKIEASLLQRALSLLLEERKIYYLSKEFYCTDTMLSVFKERIIAYLKINESGKVGDLKDALGVTRKFAVPLLEEFDAQGLTIRKDDIRRLKDDSR